MIILFKANINKYFVQKLGIDKTISFTLLTQILSMARSLVAILLVTKFLTSTEQGFYYTFTSILAIQVFFELGFSAIITQFAAHERAHLKWEDNVLLGSEINLSRLNSLIRLTFKWFSVMSAVLFVVLSVSGFIFFSHFSPKQDKVDWQMPWILMATTTSLDLLVSPVISFYEGLGKVDKTAKLRLYILLASTLGFFIALMLGAKLYSYAINNFIVLLVNTIWLFSLSIKKPLISLWKFTNRGHIISWRKEIFPYQWKIALSWMSGYFLFQLFNPILFSTVGAKAAGQMGMTQAALSGIFGLSNSWFSTKVPLFSGFIARKEYKKLTEVFNRTMKQALLVMLSCLSILFTVLKVLQYYQIPIINRFLDLTSFSILAMASIVLFITSALATYLRCHKEEPFLLLSIVSGIVNIILMFITSKYFGVRGMVSGYFFVICLGLIGGYFIFINKKTVWHGQ